MQKTVQVATGSPEQEAHQRRQIILDVLAKRRTAKDAAEALGISRKSYYQWQDRAMAAMLQAVEEQDPGRPAQARDPQKEVLEQEILALRKEKLVLEGRLRIHSSMREVIDEMLGKKPEAKKKQG